MTWRMMARLTHLPGSAQRRLWRLLIAGWVMVLLACWAGLSALTRAAEKAFEEGTQTYTLVAPLAAEVMELKSRRGQYETLPALAAAERVTHDVGIAPERLRLRPGPDPAAGDTVELYARGLDLRELTGALRDLRLQGGLRTVSAHIARKPGDARRVDLDLVLTR